MSSWPVPKYTLEEYLAIDEASDVRNEYLSGYIVAMAGNSPEHARIVNNLGYRLNLAFEDKPCEPWFGDTRVVANQTGYVYPNISITCNEPEFLPTNPKTLTNPLVIIEVLSESTQKIDRLEKFLKYQELNSLEHYVLVSQDQPLVEVYTRQPKGHWDYLPLRSLDAVMELPAIDFTLPLSLIYRRIEFPVTLEMSE